MTRLSYSFILHTYLIIDARLLWSSEKPANPCYRSEINQIICSFTLLLRGCYKNGLVTWSTGWVIMWFHAVLRNQVPHPTVRFCFRFSTILHVEELSQLLNSTPFFFTVYPNGSWMLRFSSGIVIFFLAFWFYINGCRPIHMFILGELFMCTWLVNDVRHWHFYQMQARAYTQIDT